ncbi:conserved hypothetical protein, DUF477 [Cupriavidus taiwanensis]|uniref:TPM domain-containing protein n=1 Tax=Cupriavidus taiwanensis TaxID=164546 RepID=UPI000E1658E3|nr:TPM domain-containing protein [Cupriavidus taiwanensis]SOZ99996.1 conserved hypothetical protein, DUF477 [Cupriavidus taiwanensis]
MPHLKRALHHIATTAGTARRHFPPEAQQQLHHAVHAGESSHRGEIRVVIEASLPVGDAWAGVTPRERARFLFGALEVWNTADKTGVLLYINLADHAVELLADRGIDASVGPATWRELCDELAQGLRQDLSVRPVLATVARIHGLLATHFPSDGGHNPNELDDRPVFL